MRTLAIDDDIEGSDFYLALELLDKCIRRWNRMGVPAASASPRQQQHSFSEFRTFKRWLPWMVPTFVVANIAMLLITTSINNCPRNSVSCVADFLGRFSFWPLKENPHLRPRQLLMWALRFCLRNLDTRCLRHCMCQRIKLRSMCYQWSKV